MKKIIFIFCLLLSACKPEVKVVDNGFITIRTNGISRYENEEVICYIFRENDKGGLSCKWKGDNK